MDEQRIAEIEARAEKATPGPWVTDIRDGVLYGITECGITTDGGYYGPTPSDGEFIAQSRQDIPDLIAAWREQQQRIAELEAERDGLRAVMQTLRDGVAMCIVLSTNPCPNCGTMLRLMFFSGAPTRCANCGTELEAAQEQRAEPEGGA